MRSITAIFLAFALAGCESKDKASTTETSSGAHAAADNTERNERDQNTKALTPGDQGESEADRTITQRARQNVVGADNLSINAKNVKIITQNGVVTLRGPVASEVEKTTVAQLARSVDGVQRVDNQLEVTGSTAKTSAPSDQR
jgi:hyperosmotically inducible periplasmic protein